MSWFFTLRLLALLTGLCALGGCVSTVHRAPQISVPAAFAPYRAGADEVALERWWLLFNDAQLTLYVEEALANAPDARTALAVLDEARATRRQALTRFDPQGGASISAQYQRTQITHTRATDQFVFNGALSPSWELGLFGRRSALRSAADADLDAARFAYQASRQSLASNVAGDLFEARADAVRLAQARDTLRIAADLARVGERRVAAGIGSRADAASLQADEATAQASVRALETQLEVSRRTLLVLLGRGTESLDTVRIVAALGAAPDLPAATPATLLVRRPDIREAEARLRSAAGNLRLDSLALLPTVSLSPSFSISPIVGAAGVTTTLWSLGQGLAVPLLDRRRLLAEVAGQRARTEQAVIAYEQTVQAGFAEAQSALSTYAADRARLVALERAEERARFAFTAQQAGYTAGVVDLTTLLQAERTWRANLSALSDLRATTLIDAVNTVRALGGGWPAPPPLAPELSASTTVRGNP